MRYFNFKIGCKSVVSAGFMLVVFAVGEVQSYTGVEVMLLNETSRKSITELADVSMTLTNRRGQERKRLLKVRIDDSNIIARKTFVEFATPKDVKGTRILTLEKEDVDEDPDRWIYLPALRKTRRISGSDIGESFVGTDFTYEDMEVADGVVGVKNHKYRILREENVVDALGVEKPCWVVEAIPVTEKRIKESSYSKRIIWVEQDYFTAINIEYYDKDGLHFKTQTAADVHKYVGVGGKDIWRPNRVEMTNHEKEHKTLIIFDSTIDQPILSKIFTRRFLKVGL